MTEEYVKLANSEKVFGAKSLLQSQVFLLNTIKNIRNYNSLRNEELAVKILLRRKLSEIEEALKVLDKVMPKLKDSEDAEGDDKKKTSVKKRMDLESEIEEIRRKIDRLK